MFSLDYGQICSLAKNVDADAPELRFTVLRDCAAEIMEPYLAYCIAQLGFKASFKYGVIGNVLQEAEGESSSALAYPSDYVFIIQTLESWAPEIDVHFEAHDTAAIEEAYGRVTGYIDFVARNVRLRHKGPIFWLNFLPSAYPTLGLADRRRANSQNELISRLNMHLDKVLADIGDAFVIDSRWCISRAGYRASLDRRRWLLNQMPYTTAAWREIALELQKHIRALRGKTKKVLVLDCDNTLWGGVVGEVGLAGLKLGPHSPGNLYSELQRTVLDLTKRGVLVALCSKNNEQDVWEVFDEHKAMLLRRADIVAHRINWDDKAQNLRQLAAELNLGLDSFVFVDDEIREIALIEQTLPEVSTLYLDQNALFSFGMRIDEAGWFDSVEITTTDLQRSGLYKAESKRAELRQASTDLVSFLRSLELRARIRLNSSVDFARAAQMTQRTNQFNLTTVRYTLDHIASLANSADHDVISIGVSDKYGDMGDVGLAIISHEGGASRIETFLMSCRALGKKIEDALLLCCQRLARERGSRTLHARFVRTKKNALAEKFLSQHGFSVEHDSDSSHYGELSVDPAEPLWPQEVQMEFEGSWDLVVGSGKYAV